MTTLAKIPPPDDNITLTLHLFAHRGFDEREQLVFLVLTSSLPFSFPTLVLWSWKVLKSYLGCIGFLIIWICIQYWEDWQWIYTETLLWLQGDRAARPNYSSCHYILMEAFIKLQWQTIVYLLLNLFKIQRFVYFIYYSRLLCDFIYFSII